MTHSTETPSPEREDVIAEIDRLLEIETQSGDRRTSFKISDLAGEFGVTLRTLRFYEDRGLLNPERRGTTRLYTRRDRMRLRLIQLAKTLGFSLTEAKQIIDVYDQPDGKRRQLAVARERMEEQRIVLLAQQAEIEKALNAMDVTIDVVGRELDRMNRP